MKKCFKRGVLKDLRDYYVHKQMGDGHLNKCKDCTKLDTKTRENNLREFDLEWVEKEKKRGREKYKRLGCKKQSPEDKKKTMLLYNSTYPEKRKCRLVSQRIKPLIKGNHLHHWSYKLEHAKDVIELNPSDHYKLHRHIIYDQSFFMYRTKEGVLLDTKKAHLEHYERIKGLE